MSEPAITFRIKLILALALLAVVTAFGVTYLRGELQTKAVHDAVHRTAAAEARGGEAPY